MSAEAARSCPRCGARLHASFVGKICPRCALEGAGSWDEAREDTPPEQTADLGESWKGGARVGDYERIDVLGRGGMAVVYLARHISLDRLVALKTISAPLGADAHGRERFRREARAIAQLEHPRIVSIHDVGTSGGSLYYTMDYIAGPDLGRAMRARAIPLREAASIVQKVAEAIAHAHERGVLHRDLKPGNILLDDANEPHVTDFGIALELEGAAGLTLTGDVLGTPPYMAPEALAGGHGKSGPASDVYALGAILFHLLTGRTPFTGTSASEILNLALTSSPPSPRLLNPATPRDLETVCLKCLEKSPESRYESAGALADDLRRFLAGEEIRARPIIAPVRFARWARRRPAPAALLGLLVLSALGATFAAIAFERSRERAVRAEAQAREQLFAAQLARAETLRGSKRPGQRTDALTALADAAKIKVTPPLRAAAIAALAQTDLRVLERGATRLSGNFAFAIAPDLQTTVTETQPGILEWKTMAGAEVKSRLDARAAGAVASQPTFSPDGRLLLTRHADNSIRLWALEGGHTIATLLSNSPKDAYVAFDLAWRPDSQEFALPRAGGGLTFYSAQDGHETRRWESNLAPDLVRFSADGMLVAAVSARKVVVLDTVTLAERASLELVSDSRIMSWRPGTAQLAIGCVDGRIRVVDALRGVIEQELVGHRGAILSAGYSPDGATLLTCAKDAATRLWDSRTGDTLVILPGISSTGDVQFAPNGTRAALASHDALGITLEIIRPAVVREFAAARPNNMGSLVGGLDFTRDGSRLAVATWRDVRVIETSSGLPLASFPVPADAPEECAAIFTPDGSALYTSNVARGLRRHRAASDAFADGEVLDEEKDWLVADITSDGRQLILVNRKKGEVKIADADGKPLRVFNKHPHVMFTSLSPDQKWLATQGSGRGDSAKLGGRVWSLGDETLVKEFATGPLGFVTFSADGRWLAAAGLQGCELVRVGDWNPPHNGLPADVAKTGAVVSFAADGELVAITVSEKVYLLHPATGAERGLILSPSGNTSTARARLSPDANRLAVMWDDGSFDLWDIARLRQELSALGIAD